MARLSIALVLLGLLSSGLATASPEYDQEKQNRDAQCDNDCFFGSFPGNSCANDAACMCTLKKYRERYFCCMAEKCEASVLPDSIQRQTLECEARNMEFTFDVEAACGITLTTSSPLPTSTATSTTAEHSVLSSAFASASTSSISAASTASTSVSVSAISSTGVSETSATGSQTSSGAPAPTVTDSSAPVKAANLNGFAFLVAACAMFL